MEKTRLPNNTYEELEKTYRASFFKKTNFKPIYNYKLNRSILKKLVLEVGKDTLKRGIRIWIDEDIGKYSGYAIGTLHNDWNKVMLKIKDEDKKIKKEHEVELARRKREKELQSYDRGGEVMSHEEMVERFRKLRETL